MSVSRGTTPAFLLTFDDEELDLTMAYNVYVTFRSKGSTFTVTKSGDDIDVKDKEITVSLSQEETLRFSEGPVEIQVNWTNAFGDRYASEVETYGISKQLLNEVIE